MKDGTPIEPGIYFDMPSEHYAKADGLSAGSIKRLLKTPLHYIDHYRRPDLYPPSRAMVFGRALHTCLLEPDLFAQNFPTLPHVNKQSNAGLDTLIDFHLERCAHIGREGLADHLAEQELDIDKQPGKRAALAYLEEHSGVEALTASESELLTYMRQSWDLPEHETVRNLFAGEGKNEVSVFWRDKQSGIMLKARLDRLYFLDNGTALIPDLKSCTEASYTAFSKTIPNYGYDIQAAHFIDAVLNACPGVDQVRFIFAAIEKSPPFGAAPYVFNDPQDIMTGQRKCRVGITLYKQCCELDEWPSYPNHIQPVSMPMWAKSQ